MSGRENGTAGVVYTFYSYKGGVGRSMAVANVGALLAKWGHSVLVVDWDLEAPGLERFFVRPTSDAKSLGESKPGIVDFITAKAQRTELDWRDCVHTFTFGNGGLPVSFISAGRGGRDYIDRMQALDFPVLFAEEDLGSYVEELRASWVSSFDFVLVDSRTGVTDIGGICTVHLADVLIVLFTSTDSSVEGSFEIVRRARAARGHLPLDRGQLLAVPVPARDESRTEYERAAQWKKIYAAEFESLFKDWLPSESLIPDAIELLKIPYVPYWSFGERLPALEENSIDPASLGYAYEFLARLLASKLNWNEAVNGRALAPPPTAKGRDLDDEWAARERNAAVKGLRSMSKTAFVELYHCCVDSPIDRWQKQLLVAARQALVFSTLPLPIGVVLDREDGRPRSGGVGIGAVIKETGLTGDKMYAFWALTRHGDFYSLMSLFEDDREERVIFFDTRILWTTEALLHCANLYRALGTDSNATIQLRVSYAGLRGRRISSANPGRHISTEYVNQTEDDVSTEVIFRLDQVETMISELVRKLCLPLFMLFDFFDIEDDVWNELIIGFMAGKIS